MERTATKPSPAAVMRRREEVANLFFLEEYTIEEISEYSVYSMRTIERDVEYIKKHWKRFLMFNPTTAGLD